jgi:type 1 fimbria pilin
VPAHAADSTISVEVTVVAPLPCVINGGQTIEVDFGNDVVTKQVDGRNYRRPIPYTVQCTGNTTNAMTLQMQGNGAGTGFQLNALRTNNPDLGIALYSDNGNNPLQLNNPIQFTYPAIPTLSAAPVKRSGGTLKAGTFSAGATIKVEYQ